MRPAIQKTHTATSSSATRKPWNVMRTAPVDVNRDDGAWAAITGLWKGRRVGDAVAYQRRMRKELERTSHA